MAIKHETPAACCAVVGGQGNLAASVAASPPVESVPVAGGPTVPVVTVNEVAATVPVALVVKIVLAPGAGPQDTGAAVDANAGLDIDRGLRRSIVALQDGAL